MRLIAVAGLLVFVSTGLEAAERLPNDCIRFPRQSQVCQEALTHQREVKAGRGGPDLPATNTAALREQREMEELRTQRSPQRR